MNTISLLIGIKVWERTISYNYPQNLRLTEKIFLAEDICAPVFCTIVTNMLESGKHWVCYIRRMRRKVYTFSCINLHFLHYCDQNWNSCWKTSCNFSVRNIMEKMSAAVGLLLGDRRTDRRTDGVILTGAWGFESKPQTNAAHSYCFNSRGYRTYW